jgi:hypothetical protein
MKKLSPLLILLALLPMSAVAAQLNTTTTLRDVQPPQEVEEPSPAFANVIDDLPLMPGLQVVKDEDVLFATSKARIAATTAEGPVDIDAVYDFYSRSLPQLGWKKLDSRNYLRGQDRLSIDAHAEDKTTTVKFTLHPNG